MAILRQKIVASDGLSYCMNVVLNVFLSAIAMCNTTVNFPKMDFVLKIRNNPQNLVGLPETRIILGRNVCRWDDSINMDLIGMKS
jgi:hypothetical protein